MKKKPKVYFRADGNAKMGLGHVFRSLALVEMINDVFDCIFIIREPLPVLKEQILLACNNIIEFENTTDALAEAKQIASFVNEGEVVVLDGYHFVTAYQQALKENCIKLVCIDDIHAHHFVADAVINHAFDVKKEVYSIESYTKLYLGFKYCLLRPPFLEVTQEISKTNRDKGFFICFGGTDYNNITLKAIKAIVATEIKVENVDIVIGAAHAFKSDIENYIKTIENIKINIYTNLSALEMRNLMIKNTWAIVPASTISMECFATQLKVIVGYFVDNQEAYYNSLKKHKIIVPVGDYNNLIITHFSKVIKNVFIEPVENQKLIDGLIQKRYLKLFKGLFYT
jgi:UDP-2,4-diacetamido-2,4,6-trideoxy-beta-L-altropyranose hydrolase